jgi:cyclopropane-fatty-acyl-phospholipid synthase
LKNFDAHCREIEELFKRVYGDNTELWMRRWRWFFLATADLFGHAGGNEWGVSHYRLRPS